MKPQKLPYNIGPFPPPLKWVRLGVFWNSWLILQAAVSSFTDMGFQYTELPKPLIQVQLTFLTYISGVASFFSVYEYSIFLASTPKID